MYWTLDPEQLSPAARQAIEDADRLVISSISVWEMGPKAKRGKLTIPISMPEYVNRLNRLERVEIVPVDVRTWIENLALGWEHRDPTDRTIVAMARLLGCPPVASDRRIIAFYDETIW